MVKAKDDLSLTPFGVTKSPPTRAGNDVTVLLRIDDYIAAAENNGVLVTVFHPELTPSLAFHRYFARKCGLQPANKDASTGDEPWDRKSWMRFTAGQSR